MSPLDNSVSHKGEKRRNYTMEFKREAIGYAEKNGNHKAAKNYMLLLNGLEDGDKIN